MQEALGSFLVLSERKVGLAKQVLRNTTRLARQAEVFLEA